MNYLFESFFVGVYCSLIYLLTSRIGIIHNFYLILFIDGFMKHFFAYFLGIHDYFCNTSCNKNKKNGEMRTTTDFKRLTIESIIEGFMFICLGSILSMFLPFNVWLFFVMGVLLHIISENVGIHRYFCTNRCEKCS